MSTLNVTTIIPSEGTNTDLDLDGKGSGVPDLGDGFKVGGSAGVPTASIQDDAITLAKMASGVDGVIITYDASGNPAHVGPGTDGQVLTSTGAGSPPAFEAAAAGGIGELVGPTAAGDGPSIAISGDNAALEDATSSARDNTAIGNLALANLTTGTYNIAIGRSTSTVTTDAVFNCCVGQSAGYQGTSGQRNTLLGTGAGINTPTTGSRNTCLGNGAETSAAGSDDTITLGNSAITTLRCQQTSISALSDERDKAEITDLPEEAGLDLINALRPRTFYWDMREWYEDGVRDGSKIKRNHRSWRSNSGMRQGFIAQEVETAISGITCLEDSKVVSGTADKKELGPAHLLVNAIKAIQQLSAENKALSARIKTLEDA